MAVFKKDIVIVHWWLNVTAAYIATLQIATKEKVTNGLELEILYKSDCQSTLELWDAEQAPRLFRSAGMHECTKEIG